MAGGGPYKSKSVASLLKTFLFRPYPHIEKRWVVLVLIPLFVSLFMVIFQPFGLQLFVHKSKNLLLSGYGLVTFIVLGFDMYLLPLILPSLFRESHWYIISEMLYQSWLVLSLAIGNYLYSTAFSIVDWHGFYGLFVFIGFTFSIALIPILVLIVVTHNYLLRKNLEGAIEIGRRIAGPEGKEGKVETITLHSESKNKAFETTAAQLLCLESAGNYVQCWNMEEGKVIECSLRNTLKKVEKEIKGASGIIRCHRAFIVNLRYVKKVSGNSQGYRLQLKYLDKEIPVARNFTKSFNEAFRNWR